MRQIKPKSKADDKTRSAYPHVRALAFDLGLSERSTREAIRRGDIPHIRVGKRIILPRTAIQDWLKSAGQAASAA
jgi:excisionase family DNA binding protein